MTPTPDLPACLCDTSDQIKATYSVKCVNKGLCRASTPLFSTQAMADACWTRMMTEPSSVTKTAADKICEICKRPVAERGGSCSAYHVGSGSAPACSDREAFEAWANGPLPNGFTPFTAFTAALAHARQTQDPSQAHNYEDAFYEITRLLEIPAMPISPARAYAEHVKPRLVAAVASVTRIAELEGALTEIARLNDKWGVGAWAADLARTALTRTATPPGEARDE